MTTKSENSAARTIFKIGALLGALVLVFVAGQFYGEGKRSGLFFSQQTPLYPDLKERNAAWAQRVVEGGYILHFRHAQREKWRDSTAFDAYELATNTNAETSHFARATCLTPQGVSEAKLIGQVFELVGVRVASVYSSPSCRGWQTAKYAFGDDYTVVNSLLSRTSMLPKQRPAFNENLRSLLLNVSVPEGQNVVLTGHGATFSYEGLSIIDDDRTDQQRGRHETGFVVFEVEDGKLIAHHKFASFKDFANALIELPLERP